MKRKKREEEKKKRRKRKEKEEKRKRKKRKKKRKRKKRRKEENTHEVDVAEVYAPRSDIRTNEGFIAACNRNKGEGRAIKQTNNQINKQTSEQSNE